MIRHEDIEKAAKTRYEQLGIIIKEKERALKNVPEGLLRVTKCRNNNQYFIRTSKEDFNGKYLKKNEMRQAIKLAQKEYDSFTSW